MRFAAGGGGVVEFNEDFFNLQESKVAERAIRNQLYAESVEELGLKPAHTEFKGIIKCLGGGLANFEVEYNLTAEQVMNKQTNAQDAWESKKIILLKDAAAVLNFLENEPNIVPGGYAAALYYPHGQGDSEAFEAALKIASDNCAVSLQ